MEYITVTRFTKYKTFLGFDYENEQSFSVASDMFDTFLQRKRDRMLLVLLWSHYYGGSFTECKGFLGISAKDYVITYKWEA